MDKATFENALAAMKVQDYPAAVRDFEVTLNSIDEHHESYNLVESYLGLAKVLTNDDSGLLMCRDAFSDETDDGDVYLNVACAEWHSGHRKRAIDAINKGLAIQQDHKRLQAVVAMLEERKRCVINFLVRDHPINKILGRLLRRQSQELTVHALLF